jgi:hypothetical protein
MRLNPAVWRYNMNYLLTSWRGMSKHAAILDVLTVGISDLANGVYAQALDAVSREQAPFLSFGTYYVGAHDKDGFRSTNLLALEWSEAVRADVEAALRRHRLRCVLADTYSAEDDTLCVTAIIPLDRTITDPKEYFRIASLVTGDLGVGEMSNCWAATFIGCVNPEGEITDIDGDVLEIDHRLSEGGFVKVANYLRSTIR